MEARKMIEKYPLPSYEGPYTFSNRGNIHQMHIFFESVSNLMEENKNIDSILEQYKGLFETFFIPEDAKELYIKIYHHDSVKNDYFLLILLFAVILYLYVILLLFIN